MSDAIEARQKFIDAAHRLFAERGYYGVSIAAVSAEMGLTKQALLHHFGSKEKLYGEVMRQLAGRFEGVVQGAIAQPGSGKDKARAVLLTIHDHLMKEGTDARIIVRELLDNVDRAEQSRKWYLRPLLDALAEVFRGIPEWEQASDDEVYAAMYQLVGAINYFAISGATLDRMIGPDRLSAVSLAFPAVLGDLLEAPVGRSGSGTRSDQAKAGSVGS